MNRIKTFLANVSPREAVLAAAVGLLIVGMLMYRTWILPAYDGWSAARAMAESRRLEHDKLAGFLEVRDKVEQQYAAFVPTVFQHDSDQITLSLFLRKVEELARRPSMTIVSAKPQAVELHGIHRRFPIRLAVAGTLPEVAQFVVELLNGDDVTGLSSFSVRGVQGGREVECSLVIWMVRLAPLSDDKALTPSDSVALILGGREGR